MLVFQYMVLELVSGLLVHGMVLVPVLVGQYMVMVTILVDWYRICLVLVLDRQESDNMGHLDLLFCNIQLVC